MIADFIEIKRKLDRHFRVLAREVQIKSMPIAAVLPTTIQHEGHQTQHGEIRSDYEETSATIQFHRDEIPGMTLAELERKVVESAVDVAAQVERGILQTFERVARESGQIHEGKRLTPDAFLDALDRMDIDFDEGRDKPQFPTLFAGPPAIAKLDQALSSMTPAESAAHGARKSAILDRKYAEYISRENNRRLAD